MDILKNYQQNDALRRSFNALAEETFGLSFEYWYHNGFWQENYIPYSIVQDGEVIANVSLNRTDMLIHGQRKRLYQLGTVMTKPACRNQGHIRAIMAEIEKDTRDADGIYLFANDSVLDFYPKFGFRKNTEYVYSKAISQDGDSQMRNIPMDGPEGWARLRRAMDASTFPAACRMVDNPGLIFFYVSQFMQDAVYYCEALDAWVIAEPEDGNLLLHNVFASRAVSLEEVIRAFGRDITSVTLGFTPENTDGFTRRILKEEDTTFFTKGDIFQRFESEGLRIPSLSHA